MLRIYRSNRAELLAQLLAQDLNLNPPNPFEQVEVVVNTWPTSRWLGERLASINGISALVRFPFPGSRLRQLVQAVLSTEPPIDDPWRAERLVWTVLAVLPQLMQRKEAEPLRQWWNSHRTASETLTREQWLLARQLADAVDDYALYRPQELTNWLAGDDGGNLPGVLRWQPLLVRALADRLPSDPFGLQVQRAVDHLRLGQAPATTLPRRLRLFGLSNLAPVQIDLLQALAGVMQVELYLLTPCPDLWERSARRRRRLGENWTASPDGTWLIEAPKLEAILGRMGGEFQLLLEGSGDCLLSSTDQADLFADPVAMAASEGRQASLLEQLQRQLASPEHASLQLKRSDQSLLFMGCAGPWREVQLVRDRILRWMADDPTLQPRDILVMTPDVERYAPLLASVLSDQDATGVDLPWRLTDRSQQNSPGLQQAFMTLLQLSAERLTATGLEALMSNPAFLSLQGLVAQEAMDITAALQRSGFRWGLDREERHGDDTHSLRWCLDRWLIGLILPDEPGLALGTCAPALPDLSLQQLERWWPLLDQVARWIAQLRQSGSCSAWVERLRRLLSDLFGDGGAWDWELQAIQQCLDCWVLQAGHCELNLETTVVISVLEEALSADSGRFGHRSGAMTVSALEPMRAIPHRVIVLMGLDAASFPRTRERPGFHLLERQRRLGDPSSTDQDRYVLLEALLSSRQHLLISWSSRDERRGDTLPPCPPVQQWLSLLRQELSEEAMAQVLIEPPANPLDAANFIPAKTDALSCDRRLLQARQCLDDPQRPAPGHAPLGLALPIHWTLEAKPAAAQANTLNSDQVEQLERWLQAPQRAWLRQRGIEAGEWCDAVEDRSPLALPERALRALMTERLHDELDGLTRDPEARWDTSKSGDWLQWSCGRGLLPPGAGAALDDSRLEQRWQNLQTALFSLGTLQQPPRWEKLAIPPLPVAGETAVMISTSKLQARTVLESWFKHLLNQREGRGSPTVVICRGDSSSKAETFSVAMRWMPMEPQQADGLLSDLFALADEGLRICWPIPPESGLARAVTLAKGKDVADRAFSTCWHGGIKRWAERDRGDLQACFGDDCDADYLLNSPGFDSAFDSLYAPLLEARSQ